MLHGLKQTPGGRVQLKEIEALSADELTTYLQNNHGATGALSPNLAKPVSVLTPRGNKQRTVTQARLIDAEREALHEARDYTDLCFEAENRLGLRANKALLTSARQFDKRQSQRTGATQKQLATLRFLPESMPVGVSFDVSLREVFRNRFTTNEKPDSLVAVTPRRPVRKHRYHKPWTLEESQWVPRRDTGNSNDFFETPNALHQMLQTDWEMARSHHMLAFVICKAQLSPEELRDRQINEERAVHEPCVEAVHCVLKRHAIVLYNAFDHYALLDKKPIKVDALNTAEIFYVRTPSYLAFVDDCQLEDRSNLPISMIETIFSIVDARDSSTITRDVHNIRQGLNRHEWLQVLVRLAMRKFGRVTNTHNVECRSVAVAVERLFAEHLLPQLPRVCMMNHNDFRTTFCYHEGVDSVIKSQRPSLIALYEVYASAANSGKSNEQELIDARRMSIGEWLTCLAHVGLFELGMVTHRVAMQVFCWSRIRSSKGWSNAEEIRMRHLTFEDFCEALVRLASVCALPTVKEVDAAEAANADDDIRRLHGNLGVAKFLDGEYVFEQGDEGDVFYLISAGEAEVLHYNPSDPLKEETLLNVLRVADCFGETALLKRAPRNASVMAKGDLHVAYIARPRFESVLGRSLADMRLAHTDKEALQKEVEAAAALAPATEDAVEQAVAEEAADSEEVGDGGGEQV